NSYRMPYPWCVKPAGTADNVTTIIISGYFNITLKKSEQLARASEMLKAVDLDDSVLDTILGTMHQVLLPLTSAPPHTLPTFVLSLLCARLSVAD
ncbi:hypothetical protein O5833_27040, partial [Escherichia coli]|nr:hypothetical protein [Escherichia coli]